MLRSTRTRTRTRRYFDPRVMVPEPSTLSTQPSTLNPQHSTLGPQPPTLNPQPSTLNPQPSTLNPQPSILKRNPNQVVTLTIEELKQLFDEHEEVLLHCLAPPLSLQDVIWCSIHNEYDSSPGHWSRLQNV